MLVPTVLAFRRSRPVGLLRFRPLDLMWGLGLAVVLRIVQGLLAQSIAGESSLPSFTTIGGGTADGWWLDGIIGAVLIAPVIEEIFFRALVLVTVFTMLRRPLGHLAAGIIAAMGSTGLFVLAHSMTGAVSVDTVIATTLLGFTCSAIVLLTGRIWGAVIVHAVYNASYVALAVVGTVFV